MIEFRNDYSEGAHERILSKLADCNRKQHRGYGEDEHCARAGELIKELFNCPQAEVYFISGGTQVNLIAISSVLRPHQGVLSAETGHINTHETGAIEATGHKVLSLPHQDGVLSAGTVEQYIHTHQADDAREHTVQPGMVYISNTTELGTIYTRRALEELSSVCKRHHLPLFLDGARLGHAMAAEGNDLCFKDIAGFCDLFTVGGTKQGALMGEALVVVNPSLQKDFRYLIKQRGAMMAKGWILGIQFEALFEDGLYMQLSEHASKMALKFRNAMNDLGVRFLAESPSNQQFLILNNRTIQLLMQTYGFNRIEAINEEETAVRFCFSWATQEKQVDQLISSIRKAVQT